MYFRSATDWVAIWGWPLKIPKRDWRCQQNPQDLGSKAYWELHRLSWPIVLWKSQSLFICKRQFPQGPWLLQQVKKLPSERVLRQKQKTSQLPELNHAPVSDQVRTIQLSVDTNCHFPASRQLAAQINKFTAGQISTHIDVWRQITSDKAILDIVRGCQIEFVTQPIQYRVPNEPTFSQTELKFIYDDIARLESLCIVEKTIPCEGECISTIFTTPKKDGSRRLILNLKKLNKFIAYTKCKMETLKCAISLLKKNAWMTVLDSKDAYYSVPITLEHRKYLKFYFQGQLYCFTCLPNALSCAPMIFTKLLKPVFATLKSQGHLSVSYIDDVFLQADTLANLGTNIHVTTKLLLNLGFVIHGVKSTFSGTRTQPFVGYILDTDHMVVRLTDEKINKRVNACNTMITSHLVSIRDVSHLLGLIVSAFPAAEFGPLYYRSIEIERNRAL